MTHFCFCIFFFSLEEDSSNSFSELLSPLFCPLRQPPPNHLLLLIGKVFITCLMPPLLPRLLTALRFPCLPDPKILTYHSLEIDLLKMEAHNISTSYLQMFQFNLLEPRPSVKVLSFKICLLTGGATYNPF